MTIIDELAEQEELNLAAPETRAAGRWNSAGVPGERSKDFRRALRRLVKMLGSMRIVLGVVFVVAARSATLHVFGPKVLAHGTDIIVSGLQQPGGMECGALDRDVIDALILFGTLALP